VSVLFELAKVMVIKIIS